MKQITLTSLLTLILFLVFSSNIFCDPEFLVNDYTEGNQVSPSIDMDSNGNFLITWVSPSLEDDGDDVYAKIFNKDGDVTLDDYRVNSSTQGDQTNSVVAMDKDGKFIIAYYSDDSEGQSDGIFAKIYHPEGNVIKDEFPINNTTENTQSGISIAIAPNGNIFIAWIHTVEIGFQGSDYEVYAEILDLAGNTIKDDFLIQIDTTGSQTSPAVVSDPFGNFVVTWSSIIPENSEQTYTGSDIYAKVYNSTGDVLRDDFLVNTNLDGHQTSPDLAINKDFNLLFTWQGANPEDSTGISAKLMDIDKNIIKDEFLVNTITQSSQSDPKVEMDKNGNFIITWQNSGDIAARGFNNKGEPLGVEFQINVHSNNFQGSPHIAMNESGNYVIAYQSQNQFENNSAYDVYARIFNTNLTPPPDEIPPTVEIINPMNREYVMGMIEILINAEDENGTSYIDVQINGHDWLDCYTFADYWAYHLNTNYFHDGSELEIRARAFDDSENSNVGYSDPIQVTIANAQEAPEFMVNTFSNGIQKLPAISMNGPGDFIVTWESSGTFQPSTNVFAQRYDKNSNRIGLEFKVNSEDTTGSKPAVAINDDGIYLIAWKSGAIFASLYDDEGIPIERTFEISSGGNPAVAMNNSELVVAWNSGSIFVQKFDLSFNPIFDPINVFPDTDSYEQSVDIHEDGSFVVVGTVSNENDTDSEIYAKLCDPNGNVMLESFQVNTYTDLWQWTPTVAMDGEGNFIVTWQSLLQDHSGMGIFARQFHRSGMPMQDEFQVNNVHWEHQTNPVVAADLQGNFIITWDNWVNAGEYRNIYARVFNYAAHPIGDSFKVNSSILTTTLEPLPAAGMDDQGNFVIAWENWDVYARKFDLTAGDTYPPQVTFSSPLDGQEVSSNTLIAIQVNDLIPVEKVEVQFNDGEWLECYADESFYKFELNATAYPSGSLIKMIARATDMSSNHNIGYSEPVIVLVSTGEPRVNVYTEGSLDAPGDILNVRVRAINTTSNLIDLFIAIENRDFFYWYPAWKLQPIPINLLTGTWDEIILIIPFALRPSGTYNIHAAIYIHDDINLLNRDSITLTIE